MTNFVSPLSPAQEEYRRYLQSWRWRILRRLRIKLDGGRCRMCGTTERLHVHHRDYLHRGRSWFGELFDCTTVCADCHSDYHDGD